MRLQVFQQLIEAVDGIIDFLSNGVVADEVADGTFTAVDLGDEGFHFLDGFVGVGDDGGDVGFGDRVADFVKIVEDGGELRGGFVEGLAEPFERGDEVADLGLVLSEDVVEVGSRVLHIGEDALQVFAAALFVQHVLQFHSDGVNGS